jgi:hypothetical protein
VDATAISSMNLEEGKLLDPHNSDEAGRDVVTDETSRITTLRKTPQGEINEMERKY